MSNDDVVDVLNDLIETSKDGQKGFQASADHAKSADMKSLFSTRAAECGRAAEELKAQVVACGGKPETGGTATGALHRGWMAVRSSLTSEDDQAMLEECERGEDAALKAYKKALEQELPTDVRSIVERQLSGTQRNHDQIKALRDRFKNAA